MVAQNLYTVQNVQTLLFRIFRLLLMVAHPETLFRLPQDLGLGRASRLPRTHAQPLPTPRKGKWGGGRRARAPAGFGRESNPSRPIGAPRPSASCTRGSAPPPLLFRERRGEQKLCKPSAHALRSSPPGQPGRWRRRWDPQAGRLGTPAHAEQGPRGTRRPWEERRPADRAPLEQGRRSRAPRAPRRAEAGGGGLGSRPRAPAAAVPREQQLCPGEEGGAAAGRWQREEERHNCNCPVCRRQGCPPLAEPHRDDPLTAAMQP
jgi:hypothetical protein